MQGGRETISGSSLSLRRDATLAEAIDIFRAEPGLRLLAVVDGDKRPVGAIREIDVRRILFNPFGHALMQNPSFGGALAAHVSACPVVEAGDGVGAMLDAFAAGGAGEGVIRTDRGLFRDVIPNAGLLELAAARERERGTARIARAETVGRLSAHFQQEAAELAADLARTADAIRTAAAGMAERAVQTGHASSAAATAASQAADNMGEIAARGRWLVEALAHVQAEVGGARESTGRAVSLVADGDIRLRALSSVADEITGVIGLIDSIASKVNLLALNASIEAVHAGEAGKGFGVVAAEVKSLAGQTRAAAGEVGKLIARVRDAIGDVARGHAGMASVIARIEQMSSLIDRSVAEQSGATQAIAANVDEAVGASGHIHSNIAEIGQAASEAAHRAADLRDEARSLATHAGRLGSRIDGFVAEIRAA